MAINFDLIKGMTTGVTDKEAEHLYDCAKDIPVNRILELGGFVGKSTIAMAQAMKETGGTVVTCDLFPKNAKDWVDGHIIPDTFKEFWHNLGKRKLSRNVFGIKGDIRTLLPKFSGKWGMVFIDAGHTVDQVLQDSLWAFKNVPEGGYIAWHDYDVDKWPEIKIVVDTLIDLYGIKKSDVTLTEFLLVIKR